jgi:prepilin-type N-terminal cleavage/methylation domain-containing protein
MRGGFTLVELLVVIVIIAALAGLTAPMVIRQRKKADQVEALSNAKNIGLAMFEFEAEYGSYPEIGTGTITTAAQITANTGNTCPATIATSNDAFRMLVAANFTESEQMFFCKTAYSSKKPDGAIDKPGLTAAKTLAKGDVGFGYLMESTTKAFTSAGNPGRVLCATPLAFTGGTFTADTFDFGVYDGKAVVLKMDNSAAVLNINATSKKAVLGGTNTLFDSGADTVWGATAPVIKNPDPK